MFHQQTASCGSHFLEGILVQQVAVTTMSLGYVGRLCVRAVQAAVRAEPKQQPAAASSRQAAPSKPSTTATADHHVQLAAGRVPGGGLAGPAARTTMAAAMRRRRAEKDESLMNLVFWGPN